MNVPFSIFGKQFVANTSSSKNETTSSPVSVHGNRVAMNVTVRNANMQTSRTLQVLLEGSYDRNVWKEVSGTLLEFSSFEHSDVVAGSSGGSFDYAYIRGVARIDTAGSPTSAAIVDMNVVFSKQ